VPLTSDPATTSQQAPAMQYKSILKYFAVRLCVAVTLGVLLLAAVEFYAYRRYLPESQDAMEPALEQDAAQGTNSALQRFHKEFVEANKVVYHQYVLWRRAPYRGDLLSIDLDGVRRTLHTRCDEQTFTIWMFGDSVMWGAGTPDADSIPSLVAAEYEKSGKPVCIVNYAEKGWSNTQEMVGLIEFLKHASRKPDIVLFYDGGTEAFAAYQNHRADVHSNFNQFRNFLESWGTSQKAGFSYLEQTNTYRFLKRIAGKGPFHRKQPKPPLAGVDPDVLSAAAVHNYEQNMAIIDLLAKQYGFRPVFAWYPNLAVGKKQLTPAEQQLLAAEYRKFPDLGVMYKAVYDKGRGITSPEFHYLGDALDDQRSSLYVGISHLNAEGDEIIAKRLFDILEHPAVTVAGNSSGPVANSHGK
jgi:hypothetical protein